MMATVVILGCAAALAWVVMRFSALRSRPPDSSNSGAAPRESPPFPTVARGDTPTIRLGDSQRIDRLHKVLSMKSGQHEDLLEMTFDGIPRLRVALASVEHVAADDRFPAGRDCARLHLELGGAIAGCGALVKEVAVNQFLVPLATQDEQRCSILHFHGKDDIVNFLRVKVLSMNIEQSSADIDVLHISGHWVGNR